jgi:hypothetical protein
MKWSDGSYLEDQDMWCLSGIFRDVYILALPHAAHIADYYVRTPLSFDSSGELKALQLCLEVDVSAAVRFSAPQCFLACIERLCSILPRLLCIIRCCVHTAAEISRARKDWARRNVA